MITNITSKTNFNKHQSDKPLFLWDRKLKGFGVKVNPSGNHRYVVQYREEVTNKTVRKCLGNVLVLELKEAKNKARGLLMDRLRASQVEVEQTDITLEGLLEEYLGTRALKESTQEDTRVTVRRFMGDIFNANIKDINREYVKRWYTAPENRQRGTSTDKCFRYLKAMFQFGIGAGYIESNPFDVINAMGVRYKSKAKNNHLNPEEAQRYWG